MRPDLYDRKAAARHLGVSVGWLTHHPPEKGGPAVVRLGRRVVYRLQDLDEYLDSTARVPSCPSSHTKSPSTGGTSSPIADDATVAALARQTAARLRLLSAESEPKPSPPPMPNNLVLLDAYPSDLLT